MRRMIAAIFAAGLIAWPAMAQGWSPEPWIADLTQAHEAFATKYANIDWLEQDRNVTLESLFARAAGRLRSARSDEEAKAVFDRLIRAIGDGHVDIDWPRPAPPPNATAATPQPSPGICSEMGFDASRGTVGVGPGMTGYRPLGDAGAFPAGIVGARKSRIGVLRIAGFEPQMSPPLCAAALQALHIPNDGPCDDECRDSILTWTYGRLTADLEARIAALKAAGATALLVDLTGNGGGTEWTEAAARILSPRPILSERRGFVRGPHWAEQWQGLAEQLRKAAAVAAEPADRTRLLAWAAEADAAHGDAATPCAATVRCRLVVRAGYATGLVGQARAGAFARKPWADLVFSVAQFPYHDSVWRGPLVVLVDDQTWSAAEEFAAVLQDNRAAAILGGRTGGAGCGHTNGGTPTILKNSGATLELPDCVRFRADGSNEVAGVVPDIVVGMRANDGQRLKARLIEAGLPAALRLATRLNGVRR